MYAQLTDRARKIMQFANQEANDFQHEYIGTEHILLGMVREGSGVAASVLKNLGVDLPKVRAEIKKVIQPGPATVKTGKQPPTPRAKKVLEYAIEEAQKLKHNYVGTEHLLLGLLREDEGLAAQVLMNLGVNVERARQEILNLIGADVGAKGSKDIQSHTSKAADLNDDLTFLPGEFVTALIKLSDYIQKIQQEKNALKFLPDELVTSLRNLGDYIQKMQREKEEAVAEQDFNRAALSRHRIEKLKQDLADIAERLQKLVPPLDNPE